MRCVGQPVDRPWSTSWQFTWEPDPQSGIESRVSTDDTGPHRFRNSEN